MSSDFAFETDAAGRFTFVSSKSFLDYRAGEILNARGDGVDFPMTDDEMNWMLEFFRN